MKNVVNPLSENKQKVVENPLFPRPNTTANSSQTATIDAGDAIDQVEGIDLEAVSDPQKMLANARAVREHAGAAAAKLEYQIKSGQYVPRSLVIQEVATRFQSLAQALKGIPDRAERLGVTDKGVLEIISNAVDAALIDCQESLREMYQENGGMV